MMKNSSLTMNIKSIYDKSNNDKKNDNNNDNDIYSANNINMINNYHGNLTMFM